jgi:hypothetical protein
MKTNNKDNSLEKQIFEPVIMMIKIAAVVATLDCKRE